MEEHGMYGQRAELYDLIYHFKDYDVEATRVAELLASVGIADGASVLETACGTGNFLAALSGRYRMSGLDVNPGMLAVARGKLDEDVALTCADMCDFTLDEPVDALVCLFSSIGYLEPDEQLPSALRAFHGAIRPGGALLIEPWIALSEFRPGMPFLQTYSCPKRPIALARGCTAELHGTKAVLDFHWLVSTPVGTEHFTDKHELWCLEPDELLAACDAAGFDVRWDAEGIMGPKVARGAVIGTRRD